MDLSGLPTATLAELADPESAINQIGAGEVEDVVRSRPLQTAMANVSGVLYVSRQHLGTWLPNGIRSTGQATPAVVVGASGIVEPPPPPVDGDGVVTLTILNGGLSISGDLVENQDYQLTQVSSDGSGTGAVFTAKYDSTNGVFDTMVSVDTAGSGYIVGEVITSAMPGSSNFTAPTFTVTAIG